MRGGVFKYGPHGQFTLSSSVFEGGALCQHASQFRAHDCELWFTGFASCDQVKCFPADLKFINPFFRKCMKDGIGFNDQLSEWDGPNRLAAHYLHQLLPVTYREDHSSIGDQR